MEKTFENLLSVSGMSGLYYLVANRPNGLIIQDIASGKRSFASMRKHNFTPLMSIGVYTEDGEAVQYSEVLKKMHTHESAPPEPTASDTELTTYFAQVLPNYHREMVRLSDMKKAIKWYLLIQRHTDIEALLAKEEE